MKAAGLPSIAHDDPLPPGPYAVGLTHTSRGDSRPYTITCADGRAICGHVESRACADAIVAAMNACARMRYPFMETDKFAE